MRKPRNLSRLLLAAFVLAACGAPGAVASEPSATPGPPTETALPSATATPEASPTPALLDLEILEWFEHPIANLVDPSSGVTNVEVLIRNPNDFHVSIGENAELRFLNSAGEVVYTNPSPTFYIWPGVWMTPGQTAALQVCMCLESEGSERPEWESLELIAPLEITNPPAYTTDVEVTAEFVLLEEVLHGYSGPGVDVTLTNTSDQVLEAIAKLVFAYDASGRYVGMASYGSAVVSFREDIETQQRGIQPGDTAHGFEDSEIDYLGNERLTYEVAAIGIIATATPTPGVPEGTPSADWQGVPIMPGAISGGEEEGGYRFSTQATIEEITQFYEAAITELGYSLTTSGEQSGITFLFFEQGSSQAIVAIFPAGELNFVQISVTP
ncbi:MAG: hypothetical protein WEC37_04570 [Anaerolineales bacterium]